MKKILSLIMAMVLSASVGLFSACESTDNSLNNQSSSSQSLEDSSSENKCMSHAFSEWETVTEASCVAGQKQRVCGSCNEIETEEIPALDDFFAHTFDENTLCTSCGYQEFIESEEYVEINECLGSNNAPVSITWWNIDKTYALRIYAWGDFELPNNGGNYNIQYYSFSSAHEGAPKNIIFPSYFDNIPITLIKSFAFCKTLEVVIIPKTIKEIETWAFQECVNLKEVIFLGNELEPLYIGHFFGCISLTEITLPRNLTYLSLDAFLGCKALTTINVSKNTEIFIPDYHIHSYMPGAQNIKYYD